jgi:hypothetical protein
VAPCRASAPIFGQVLLDQRPHVGERLDRQMAQRMWPVICAPSDLGHRD